MCICLFACVSAPEQGWVILKFCSVIIVHRKYNIFCKYHDICLVGYNSQCSKTKITSLRYNFCQEKFLKYMFYNLQILSQQQHLGIESFLGYQLSWHLILRLHGIIIILPNPTLEAINNQWCDVVCDNYGAHLIG